MISYSDSLQSTGLINNIYITGNVNDPLENLLGVFPCTRLCNLPSNAGLEDVLIFFQGLVILDVVVDNDREEAFVVFANPMDFQMALQRDRLCMGRRYVEVYQGKRSEYYAAIASQHSPNHASNTENDENSKSNHENSGTGNAWSTKKSSPPSPPQTQSTTSQKAPIGNSSRVPSHPAAPKTKGSANFRPNRGSFNQNPSHKHHRGNSSSGGGIQIGEHTGYLRMRGLPFTATKQDILTFFEDFQNELDQDSIALTYRNDGRPTGEAYVGFCTPEDAKEAMVLHRNMMGSRYIELFISSKEEHSRSLARSR